MKRILLLSFFIFLVLLSIPVLAQSAPQPDDEFLAFLLIFGTVVIALIIGAGAVLCTVALLIIAGLVSFGVLSASLLAGIYKRSFQTGFKVFMLTGGGVAGLLIGAAGSFVAARVFHMSVSDAEAALYGGLAGVVGGIIAGWISFFIIKWFVLFVKGKLAQ